MSALIEETLEPIAIKPVAIDQPESLPFPYNQRSFCRYESIEKRIERARVLVVDSLLRDESDLSDYARATWGAKASKNISRERYLSSLAIDNILSNITRLVREPETEVAHLSEVAKTAEVFCPEAIVLSGTLSDFDYYNPSMLERFGEFIRSTKIPVLGICGGHQLVGQSFGARVVTLVDHLDPKEISSEKRPFEYQYHLIKITAPDDPIFQGIHDPETGRWQEYTTEGRIMRVWQNHGLELDRVPDTFRLLAVGHRCRIQMMARRAEGQLIHSVQFHLEKSFQDLSRSLTRRFNPNRLPENRKRMLREDAMSRTRWEHPNESRDGRIVFENFLREALEHVAQAA